jgi:hypothetical protein
MKKLHQFFTLTLLLTFATPSIHGQDPQYQEDATYSSAYMQSSHAAHWSVYIPIALLVGAAIWFGVADRNHECHDYNDSQDALGSIANSKRRSSTSYCSRFKKSPSSLSATHGHH